MTETKSLLESSVASDSLAAQILEAVDAQLVLVDSGGKIVVANEQWTRAADLPVGYVARVA